MTPYLLCGTTLYLLHTLHSIICMTILYPSNSPGNKYTLKTRPQEQGVDVREELLKYHDKYYSSNLMTLAIVGKGTSSAQPVLECVYCYFFVISIRQMKH